LKFSRYRDLNISGIFAILSILIGVARYVANAYHHNACISMHLIGHSEMPSLQIPDLPNDLY